MTEAVLTRARNAGHSPLNNQIRDDWRRLIEIHPDSFDVLIYIPNGTQNTPEEPTDETALFGDVDIHQHAISYDLPQFGSCLVATLDDPAFSGMWDEPDSTGDGASGTLTVLLSAGQAPVGSILEWAEEDSNGENRLVWWYVHSVDVIGTASAGALHICIPCGDLESAQQEAAAAILEGAA